MVDSCLRVLIAVLLSLVPALSGLCQTGASGPESGVGPQLLPNGFECKRIQVAPSRSDMDANIYARYEIEKSAWVWHPGAAPGKATILQFKNEFTLLEPQEITVHLSADQRYELSLDGRLIALGPDRSDLEHWSFASYRIKLPRGTHRLEVSVSWFGSSAPTAQLTYRGGFIFACEGELASTLNTGSGRWLVREIEGNSTQPNPLAPFSGARQVLDGRKIYGLKSEYVTPVVVTPPLTDNVWGVMREGWRLHPSRLPDQQIATIRPGKVRAIIDGGLVEPKRVESEACAKAAHDSEWSLLLAGKGRVTIPPQTTLSVLVDLENYYCAYPHLVLSGGQGGKVVVAWNEALYDPDKNGGRSESKGNRDQVAGKTFVGNEDWFLNDGGAERDYRTWWWRAGRYVLITVHTDAEALRIDGFDLLSTRYPLEDEGRFTCSDEQINAFSPLLVRGLQMCAHETYVDCPFYEQLMYVGDTRVQMLATYAMSRDTALAKRAMEMFDWSQGSWGIGAMHYPSQLKQLSPTYSLIWISMLRDFCYWRDEPDFVRARLAGMRSVLERLQAMRGKTGLLEQLPGWPFIDWVRAWNTGMAPGGKSGISSINNLLFIQSLRDAADVEDACGDPDLAKRNRRMAREISDEVVRRFWDPRRSLLADDEQHTSFSEHAQCLALLNDVLDDPKKGPCFDALIAANDLHRATVYFSFYLFETFKRCGRGDLIVKRLDFWKQMLSMGLKTPLEAPEPARSDCHGWGSHPLFHERASLFGVRPTSAGFHTLDISPSPGPLRFIEARIPHPSGWIEGRLEFDATKRTCSGEITLPIGVAGNFHWQGKTIRLKAGTTTTVNLQP